MSAGVQKTQRRVEPGSALTIFLGSSLCWARCQPSGLPFAWACLEQRPQASLLALAVEQFEGPWFPLEQFDELRGAAVQAVGGGPQLELAGLQHIERFGEQCGEVGMTGGEKDASGNAPLLPDGSGAWWIGRIALPDLQSQIDTQPRDSIASILLLTPPLAGRSAEAGGQVRDDNGRFDFIAVLTTRSTAPLPLDFTLLEQSGFVPCCWMDAGRRARVVAKNHCFTRWPKSSSNERPTAGCSTRARKKCSRRERTTESLTWATNHQASDPRRGMNE